MLLTDLLTYNTFTSVWPGALIYERVRGDIHLTVQISNDREIKG